MSFMFSSLVREILFTGSNELDEGTTEFCVMKALFEGFAKNGNTDKFYGANHA